MKKFIIFIFIFLILLLPAFSFAQTTSSLGSSYGGLVPCGQPTTPDGKAIVNWQCDFYDILTLINNVIKFILFYMAIPIAAIMFAYAGFLLVTAGGEAASARTKARSIFTNALLGLVLAAAAWLIVKTLLGILGYNDIGMFFN